jgi:hypothetical protein
VPEGRLRRTRQAYDPNSWRARRVLRDAPVTVRVWHCLARWQDSRQLAHDALTLGELDALPDWQLLNLQHFGRKSLTDLRAVIAEAKRDAAA